MSKSYPKPYKWFPVNTGKYVGDINNIWVRSSWEKRLLLWCDKNNDIKYYSSEEIIIPYLSPVDNKIHKYFVDFFIITHDNRKFLVEVKPSSQCNVPKPTKNKKRMLTETTTYLVNQAKWDAATKFCERNDMKFLILTEKHLFNKK